MKKLKSQLDLLGKASGNEELTIQPSIERKRERAQERERN